MRRAVVVVLCAAVSVGIAVDARADWRSRITGDGLHGFGRPSPPVASVSPRTYHEAQARRWEEIASHYAMGNSHVQASRHRAAAKRAAELGLDQPMSPGERLGIAEREELLHAQAVGAARHYRYGTVYDDARRHRAAADAARELGLTGSREQPEASLFAGGLYTWGRNYAPTRRPNRPDSAGSRRPQRPSSRPYDPAPGNRPEPPVAVPPIELPDEPDPGRPARVNSAAGALNSAFGAVNSAAGAINSAGGSPAAWVTVRDAYQNAAGQAHAGRTRSAIRQVQFAMLLTDRYAGTGELTPAQAQQWRRYGHAALHTLHTGGNRR